LSGCQDYIWSPGETESDWLSGEDQPMKRSLLSLVGDFVDSSCSHRKTSTVSGCQWSEMQKKVNVCNKCYRSSGSVEEQLPCEPEVMGSISESIISKTL